MLVPMGSSGGFLCGPIGLHFGRCAAGMQSNKKSPRRGFFKFTSSLAEAAPHPHPLPAKKGGAREKEGSMRVGPDLLLGKIHQSREDDQEHEDLQPKPLAVLHVWLRGPHQERGDVMRVLRNAGWRTA